MKIPVIEMLRFMVKILIKIIMLCVIIIVSPALFGAFLVEFSQGNGKEFCNDVIDFLKGGKE